MPRRETRGNDTAGWRETVLPVLHDALRRDGYDWLVRWWHVFLLDRSLDGYVPALIHSDLWYDHVLTDAAHLNITGLIDFESAAIGDIAWEFAAQCHVGTPFADLVIAADREARGVLEDAIDHQVQRLWELQEFEGRAFAIRVGDTIEIQDALRMLRAGPVLHGAPGVGRL